MVGVTYISVAPMVAMANSHCGVADVVSILIARLVSRLLRFSPLVTPGTIIAVIGISQVCMGIR